jgi:hypothetical protein
MKRLSYHVGSQTFDSLIKAKIFASANKVKWISYQVDGREGKASRLGTICVPRKL